MANVSNGKHFYWHKSPGVIKDLDNGKCLNWQTFLLAKVTRSNEKFK